MLVVTGPTRTADIPDIARQLPTNTSIRVVSHPWFPPVAAPRAILVAGAAPGTGAGIGTRTTGTTGTGGGTARSPNKNAGHRPVGDPGRGGRSNRRPAGRWSRTPAGQAGPRPLVAAGIGMLGRIRTVRRWSTIAGPGYPPAPHLRPPPSHGAWAVHRRLARQPDGFRLHIRQSRAVLGGPG
jgi:hypothetical protein